MTTFCKFAVWLKWMFWSSYIVTIYLEFGPRSLLLLGLLMTKVEKEPNLHLCDANMGKLEKATETSECEQLGRVCSKTDSFSVCDHTDVFMDTLLCLLQMHCDTI